MSSLNGQWLGQYEIVSLIGQGGMAAVYRAHQPSMKRDVAIKIIESKLANNPEFVKRFEREAQTVAALSHINILKVFEYGRQDDLVYLVMELLTGGSLAELIRKGPLSMEASSRLLDQVASALDYAHELGVIHRDLKPQNVLLDGRGNAVLTDFGIVKLMGETTALTQSGTAIGTPAYMAPEQWRGEPVDSRLDIYALGVMLFEMLTGTVPFPAATPFSMMHSHIYEPPPLIRRLRSDLPAGVEQVVNQALAKDREQRYASAGQMAADLKAAITEKSETVTLRRPSPTRVATPASERPTTVVSPSPSGRRRVLSIVGLVGGLVVVGALALFLLNNHTPVEPTRTSTLPGQTAAAFQPTTSSPTVPPATTATKPASATAASTSALLAATSTWTLAPTTRPTSNSVVIAPTIPPPTKTPTIPTNTPTVPTKTPTIPTNTPTVPTKTPTIPTNTPTVPTNTPTVPTKTPTIPTSTPTVPTSTPTVPTNTPTVPTNTPTVPTNTPTVPTKTPTVPTVTPTPDPKSFERLVSVTDSGFDILDGLKHRLSGIRANTPGGITSGDASWSPDGTRLLFSAHPSKTSAPLDSEIYIVNADGTTLTRLTTDTNNDVEPSWSPDGGLIAFHSSCDLRLIRPDGVLVRRIGAGAAGGFACVSVPHWSPDGAWLAFVGTDMERYDPAQVWVVRRNGQNLQRVFSGPKSGQPWDALLAWSPDGARLIYRLGGTSVQILTQCFKQGSACDATSVSSFTGQVPASWLPNFFPQWAGEDVPRFAFLTIKADKPVSILASSDPSSPVISLVGMGDNIYVHGVDVNDSFPVMTSFGQNGWVAAKTLGFQRFTFSGVAQNRSGPGYNYDTQGTIVSIQGSRVDLWATGRDAGSHWIQILYQGRVGWIEYPRDSSLTNLQALPVRTS